MITLGAFLRLCVRNAVIVVGDSGRCYRWRFRNDHELHWDCNLRVLHFQPLDEYGMKRFHAPKGGFYVVVAGGCCRG